MGSKKKDYLAQSEEFYKANFRVYGIGHFDVYIDEMAEILRALDTGDYHLLSQLYERLERRRMG